MKFPERPLRLPPLAEGRRSAEQARLLASVGVPGLPATNVFATIAHNERLLRAWLPFCGKLLSGSIPAREREIVVLRTGWRCESPYEWAQHSVLGRRAGLTAEEIERIAEGPGAPGWSTFEAALLRAVDELHDTNAVSDATWDVLSARLGAAELVELVLLIGQYHLVSYALNAFGTRVEESGTEAVAQ